MFGVGLFQRNLQQYCLGIVTRKFFGYLYITAGVKKWWNSSSEIKEEEERKISQRCFKNDFYFFFDKKYY